MAYITTADMTAYRGITSTADNTIINSLILEAQAWFERETGRQLESASETHYFDPEIDVEGDTLFVDKDLLEVTSITLNDGTTFGASDYVLEPRNESPKYAIKIRSDSAQSWDYEDYHENSVTIVGTWGYSTAAFNDIKLALKEMVTYLYYERETSFFDVQVIPGEAIVVPQGFPRRALRAVISHRRHLVR